MAELMLTLSPDPTTGPEEAALLLLGQAGVDNHLLDKILLVDKDKRAVLIQMKSPSSKREAMRNIKDFLLLKGFKEYADKDCFSKRPPVVRKKRNCKVNIFVY